MTIPYLTTWTVADLAFLRTAIETCEQRCPTCAHYPPGTSHSICSGPCKGTGKLYDYTLCDWLPRSGCTSGFSTILATIRVRTAGLAGASIRG